MTSLLNRLKTLPHVMISSTISLTMPVVSIVDENLGQTRTPSRHTVSKHSSSLIHIPVKVPPSPLGAMVLYCYHTATYYPINSSAQDMKSLTVIHVHKTNTEMIIIIYIHSMMTHLKI